ncbi:type II toxin-antitoxin system HicA family toxin [Microbacterium arborescens]|uniref:type II toxin-antitoxin system HicA family toxin n=1 Tax=Microbacterium arborescens TaxID=33883 RepID=UPI003C783924
MTERQKHRDVSKFLRSKGWEHVRTKGSHETWKSPDGAMTLVVAAHGGEVSAGIVRQIQNVFDDTPGTGN